MDQPIEYVGGEPERPPARPWWLLAVVPAILALGLLVVFAGPGMVASARGQVAIPYTIGARGSWSAADQVVGAPVTLAVEVKNTDTRTLQGLTVRFTGLASHWKVVGATPDGEVSPTAVYFGRTLAPGESESLEFRMVPVQAGQWKLLLRLTAGRSDRTMSLATNTGTAHGLTTNITVREASPTDLAATAHLFYSDANLLNQSSAFRLHVDNTGAVQLTGVTVRFAQVPASFELRGSQPSSTLGSDGQSLTFTLALDPGQGTDLNIYYVPHQTGTYRVSIQFLLGDQTDPVVLPGGTSSIDVTVTVN